MKVTEQNKSKLLPATIDDLFFGWLERDYKKFGMPLPERLERKYRYMARKYKIDYDDHYDEFCMEKEPRSYKD